MTTPPKTSPPLPYEDEVLRRMLSTPPKPHAKPKPKKEAARNSKKDTTK